MKRGTLAAALLLAGLSTYIFIFERGPRDDSSEGEKIFAVAPDEIRSIRIERPLSKIPGSEDGKVSLSLSRTDGEWRLTEPLRDRVDEDEIDLLLRNIVNLEKRRTLDETSTVALEDFGLDPASVELGFRFQTERGESYRLSFGSETPTGVAQYAMRDDEGKVLVVAPHFSNNFDLGVWDVRNKAIFDGSPDASSVSSLRIERSGVEAELVLERKNELWYLSHPVEARADRYDTEALARRLLAGEMEEIVAEEASDLDLAEIGLDPPEIAIGLALTAGTEPLVLSLGAEKDGDRYATAAHRSQVFLIDRAVIEGVERPLMELVSKRLFEPVAARVTELEIIGDTEELRRYLRRGDDDEARWYLTPSETGASPSEVPRARVDDLLYRLGSVRAAEVLGFPQRAMEGAGEKLPYGLDRPSFVVSVTASPTERRETIRVGLPQTVGEDRFVFVRRDEEPFLLKLPAETWDELVRLMSFDEALEAP